ncbi:hypothetical protein ACH5RR_025880 [Cinchona calisaya]|uniref:Uncharacterized protein n=1 Tax=Cinchona calisaya TaxID=153742 RepID=A0ABD2Z0X3_9GENT
MRISVASVTCPTGVETIVFERSAGVASAESTVIQCFASIIGVESTMSRGSAGLGGTESQVMQGSTGLILVLIWFCSHIRFYSFSRIYRTIDVGSVVYQVSICPTEGDSIVYKGSAIAVAGSSSAIATDNGLG